MRPDWHNLRIQRVFAGQIPKFADLFHFAGRDMDTFAKGGNFVTTDNTIGFAIFADSAITATVKATRLVAASQCWQALAVFLQRDRQQHQADRQLVRQVQTRGTTNNNAPNAHRPI